MNAWIQTQSRFILFLLCLFATPATLATPVTTLTLQGEFDENYLAIRQALDDHRFYVIFEPNIGASLSNFKERWGEDYNRNSFEEIQSLVFCNPWYVNQVLNKDPEMSALCPLSVTLLHKEQATQIMFLRPSALKPDSPAQSILQELETDIIKALKTSGAQ